MSSQTKAKYRIRNWSEYNKALIQRGSITVWVSSDALQEWRAPKEKKRGRPCIYSDAAILCALMVKSVYHLPFRALAGFLVSFFSLLNLSLPIPSYTQICRRAKKLGKGMQRVCSKRSVDIVFDSTGLKIYGEGEWKVRTHGKGKRRTWRKMHLGVDPQSHNIVMECLTEHNIADCVAFQSMEKLFPKSIKRCFADGAYDKEGCYKLLHKKGIEPIIPPQKNAAWKPQLEKPWMQPRQNSIAAINGLGGDEEGRVLWKKLIEYHRRSLAETAMSRFKTLLGASLKSRKMPYQRAEVYAKCLVINRMNSLGMPKREWVM